MSTVVICAAGVASDPVVARVIDSSLRGAALGQERVGAAGLSLLEVVLTDLSPQEAAVAAGRAAAVQGAAEAGRAEVVVATGAVVVATDRGVECGTFGSRPDYDRRND